MGANVSAVAYVELRLADVHPVLGVGIDKRTSSWPRSRRSFGREQGDQKTVEKTVDKTGQAIRSKPPIGPGRWVRTSFKDGRLAQVVEQPTLISGSKVPESFIAHQLPDDAKLSGRTQASGGPDPIFRQPIARPPAAPQCARTVEPPKLPQDSVGTSTVSFSSIPRRSRASFS